MTILSFLNHVPGAGDSQGCGAVSADSVSGRFLQASQHPGWGKNGDRVALDG